MRGAEKQPLSVCNYAIMTQVASDVRRDKIDPYTRRWGILPRPIPTYDPKDKPSTPFQTEKALNMDF